MAKTKQPGLPKNSTGPESGKQAPSLLWQLINALSLRPGSSDASSRSVSGLEITKNADRPQEEKLEIDNLESEIVNSIIQTPRPSPRINNRKSTQEQKGTPTRLLLETPTTVKSKRRVSTERRILRNRRMLREQKMFRERKNGEEQETEKRASRKYGLQGSRIRSLLEGPPAKQVDGSQVQVELRRTRQNTSVDDVTYDESILSNRRRKKQAESQKTAEVTRENKTLDAGHFQETSTPVKGQSKVRSVSSAKVEKTPVGETVVQSNRYAKLPEASTVVAPTINEEVKLEKGAELTNGNLTKIRKVARVPISLLVNATGFEEPEQNKLFVTDQIEIKKEENSSQEKRSIGDEKFSDKKNSSEVEKNPGVSTKVIESNEASQKESPRAKFSVSERITKGSEPLAEESQLNTAELIKRRKRRYKRYEKSNRRVIINPSSESEASLSSLLDSDSESQQVEVVPNGSVDYTDLEKLMIDELVRDQRLLEAHRPINIDDDEDEQVSGQSDDNGRVSAKSTETREVDETVNSHENGQQIEIATNGVRAASHADPTLDILVGFLTVEPDDKRKSKRRKMNQKRKSAERKLFRGQRKATDELVEKEGSALINNTDVVTQDDIDAQINGEARNGIPTLQAGQHELASSPRTYSTAVERQNIGALTAKHTEDITQTTEQLFVSSSALDSGESGDSSDVSRLQVVNSQDSPPHTFHRKFDPDTLRAAFAAPLATLTQTNQPHIDFTRLQKDRKVQPYWQRSVNSSGLPTLSISKSRKHRIQIIPYPKEEVPPQQSLKSLAEELRERFQKAGNMYVGFVGESYDSD